MRADPSRAVTGARQSRLLLAAAALAVALASAAIAQAAPNPTSLSSEANALTSSLSAAAQLTKRQLAPGAAGLARGLPGQAERLESLHQPAATSEEQLRLALGQMQQMSPLPYDPHYLPALIAVGRAHLAATGTDPLSATFVNPEYAGLGNELARGASALRRSAGRAAQLSRQVKSLSRELAAEKRRAARLARALKRLARPATPARS